MSKHCLKCDAPLDEERKVCPRCGYSIESEEQETERPKEEQAAVEAPAAETAPVADAPEETDEKPVKKKRGLWWKLAIPVVLLAAVAALFLTGVLHLPRSSTPAEIPEGVVTVPDVRGMSLEEALEAVESRQLLAVSGGTMESEDIPAGHVILQEPMGGAYADANDTLTLLISSGKGVEVLQNGISTVPYVVWDSRENAVIKLQQAGLGEPQIKRVYDDHVAFGHVVAQSDEAGKQVTAGKVITIKVSIGAQTFDMPDVVREPITEAKVTLTGLGLKVHLEYRQDSSIPVNQIISQSVEAKSAVRRGDEVTLVVSSAKKIVSPAEVQNMMADEAEETLQKQGFQVVILENYDDSVPEGRVISQTPRGETSQTEGQTVVLYVSKGKHPVEVTFDANGGKATKRSKTVFFSENYGELPTASKKGESFVGWYTAKTAGEKIVNSSMVSNFEDHTLYARYSSNTYKVTLDANGGTVSPGTVTVAYNELYGTLPTPHKTGYTFQGWYTAKAGGQLITSSMTVSIIADQTLYARWGVASSVVTFDANGGSPASSYKNVTFGNAYGELPTVTRVGYHFSGWYTSPEGGSRVTADTLVMSDTSHTVYARWTANPYQVTLDANGGSVSPKTLEVHYGAVYGTLPTPTRAGYSFQGWYTAQNGGNPVTKDATFSEAGNQTIYAHWTAGTYTVSFSGNGGSVSSSGKSVTYGGTYGELPGAGRTGYSFAGWYTAASGGTQVKKDTKVTATGPHTLYAHWKVNSYTLTFNANGGSVSPSKTSVAYGAAYGTLPTPTRSSYTFNGWYTAASGGTQVSSSTKMTGNITIYAQWTQKPVSGWVLASQVPAGAQILERKYTYDVTSYTTSSSSSLSGWTRYDAVCSSWGATQGPVYSDPSNGSRDVWTEQYEVGRTTHYKYYHRYGRGYDPNSGEEGMIWGTDSSLPGGDRHTIDLTYALSVYQSDWAGTGVTAYKGSSCGHDGQAYIWFADGTYDDIKYGTRWYYREPIYTYYYMKVESHESTVEPSGSGVSNVKEYVRYR